MANALYKCTKALITLGLLLLLMAGATHVGAQGPTATSTPVPSVTPTLRAVPPTVTSVYLYLRPTPTQLVFHPENYSALNISPDSALMADQAINVYRGFNQDHIVDAVVFFMVAGMLCLYIVRFIARSTKDD